VFYLQIQYKSLKELKEYENNPRNNERAVEVVANSIQEFGFRQPILIDKENVIVAGHTRYKASIKLGLTKVPTILVDDLTEEQVKAYRLVDNKTSEYATWDDGRLREELETLSFLDLDMKFDLKFEDELEEPAKDELDEMYDEISESVVIKITFNSKNDMKKIEEDLRAYIDNIPGAKIVVQNMN
jgi:site-specific DNA-methyltransferase (adenine-specific)